MRRIREKREKGEGATHPPAEATPSSERAKSADSDVTPKATTSNKVTPTLFFFLRKVSACNLKYGHFTNNTFSESG